MKNGTKIAENVNLNTYEHDVIYRSLPLTPSERFGLGLMFKPGSRLEYDNEIHPRFALIIVLRGEGTLYDGSGEKIDLKAGMCFKRIPGRAENMSINDGCGWVEFFIEIGPALYQALRAMRIIDTKRLCENIIIDKEFFTELLSLKERFKTVDERDLPLLTGDFVRILALCKQRCLSYGMDRETVFIDRACGLLGRDFSSKCDLKAFCRKQGIGYENFRKQFKRQIGISPWQYRIRRRLDLACALLQNPDMQVSEIAFELGYASAYDFSAQFKKHFKVSPANYRIR
ncbi:MAG: helix-turn-helix domain-containing protein [Victivallaceae bacterium]